MNYVLVQYINTSHRPERQLHIKEELWSHLEGKACKVFELAAINCEAKADICLPGGISKLFSHKGDVWGGGGAISVDSWVEKKGDLHLSGNNWVLGDETDLADHLQRVQNVDGAISDRGTGRESIHCTGRPLNAQDRDGRMGHLSVLTHLKTSKFVLNF